MKKEESRKFNSDALRFDGSWKFIWEHDSIFSNVQRFSPFSKSKDGDTWTFCGDASADIVSNEFYWNPEHPVLHYDADFPAGWDFSHPNNPTRYLGFDNDDVLVLSNRISKVYIDDVPPEFVSDIGTEYFSITKNSVRKCEFVIKDSAGLDYKQFVIKIGTDDSNILYSFLRKHDYQQAIDDGFVNPIVDNNKIDKQSIKISFDGYNTYKLEFNLKEVDGLVDELNEHGLVIEVWDRSSNKSIFSFGKNEQSGVTEHIDREWFFLETKEEIDRLKRCVINFEHAEPSNLIVEDNTEGSVWCRVTNPNKNWLNGTQINIKLSSESIGRININTFDDSSYLLDGSVYFKIDGIVETGNVVVEAYIYVEGNENLSQSLINFTFNIGEFGVWRVIDSEGRKINIERFTPKYLKNSDYGRFIEFFQLYLNSLYTDLSKQKNISVLEKIARIGDFNDVDKIESQFLYKYMEQMGCDVDFDVESLMKINLGIKSSGYERTEEDVFDVIRYFLKNLPYYNQIKGSSNGMIFILKMFSLSCRVINLWVKTEPTIEENPTFYSEDSINDYSEFFLTSRFDLDLFSGNIDYEFLNSNLKYFIRLIESIKPITKILNRIKYLIEVKKEIGIMTNNSVELYDNSRIFNFDYYFDFNREKSVYNDKNKHLIKLYVPFYSTCKITSDVSYNYSERMDNYTLLMSLIKRLNSNLVFGICWDRIKYRAKIRNVETNEVRYENSSEFLPEVTRTISINIKYLNFEIYDSFFYIFLTRGSDRMLLYRLLKETVYPSDETHVDLFPTIANNEFIEELTHIRVGEPYLEMNLDYRIGTDYLFCGEPLFNR